MTIESAIGWLHNLEQSDLLFEKEKEAVNLAISALLTIKDGNYIIKENTNND